ncbi:MAG: cytochrome c3 family protein [Planctomycetes bacterium]|nr:cytochrome c3 family protein [Planctomycetota bacterium]
MNAKLAILFLMLTIGTAMPVLLGIRDTFDVQLANLHTGYQPEQPIPYSHRLHAGYLNIDCQYCHTAADQSRHAGVPNLQTCMNCHNTVKGNTAESKERIALLASKFADGTGVEWKRVHNNPDFVYFNHMTHVRIAKNGEGFTCQECHGPIENEGVALQQNILSMGWCLNCHRTWNEEYKKQGWEPAAPLNCDACHR